MDRPKCGIKNCERGALIAYGDRWICGECMMKLINKEKAKKEKEMEELGND